jgi:esterase
VGYAPRVLFHETVARGEPERWLVLTHGIYGSGANLRTVAKRLVEKRPDWGVHLVDLRLHGRSPAGDPPHTIAACAEDLRALVAELGGVGALAGHSFGGKVVLATRALVEVAQTWVLDASPSAHPGAIDDPRNTVAHVLALMERLPKTWARRDDFVDAVVAEGQAKTLAQWLAMNVVPAHGQFELRFDLPAIRALLTDYYAQDLWSLVDDPTRGELVFVIADRSNALGAEDRARLAQSPVIVEHVAADHWLHVDAPDAVVELFATRLPTRAR